ncbi:MAG: hypothetical protein QOF78_3388 [Phycisphaerales bacterium]|jgi:hypothetical protein|nr:hypothetical protein [Phycisphaerales bacterium]
MLGVLGTACEKLLTSSDEFWTLAALTERSFEVGSAPKFAESVKWYEEAGVVPELIAQLRRGINGRLAALLERDPATPHPVHYNRRRDGEIPDVCCGSAADGTNTLVEIKMIYDCTMEKWYAGSGVAGDAEKLRRRRRGGFVGNLYQVVIFVSLPNFDYPAGVWYPPKWTSCPGRGSYLHYRGIDAQYRRVRNHQQDPPAWPDGDAPRVVTLAPISADVAGAVDRWFDVIYRPATPWRFVPANHLHDAAVGAGIWSY